jgi:hypothetical protein
MLFLRRPAPTGKGPTVPKHRSAKVHLGCLRPAAGPNTVAGPPGIRVEVARAAAPPKLRENLDPATSWPSLTRYAPDPGTPSNQSEYRVIEAVCLQSLSQLPNTWSRPHHRLHRCAPIAMIALVRCRSPSLGWLARQLSGREAAQGGGVARKRKGPVGGANP